MSLPSSMADFVPCDRLLQKAYCFLQASSFNLVCIAFVEMNHLPFMGGHVTLRNQSSEFPYWKMAALILARVGCHSMDGSGTGHTARQPHIRLKKFLFQLEKD